MVSFPSQKLKLRDYHMLVTPIDSHEDLNLEQVNIFYHMLVTPAGEGSEMPNHQFH